MKTALGVSLVYSRLNFSDLFKNNTILLSFTSLAVAVPTNVCRLIDLLIVEFTYKYVGSPRRSTGLLLYLFLFFLLCLEKICEHSHAAESLCVLSSALHLARPVIFLVDTGYVVARKIKQATREISIARPAPDPTYVCMYVRLSIFRTDFEGGVCSASRSVNSYKLFSTIRRVHV